MSWDRDNTKYISFKETDADIKLSLLLSNNITNSKIKYEVLEDLDINQYFIRDKEKFWLREFLLDIKVDRKKLFAAIEEGVGKHSKDILVMDVPLQKIAAHK